MFPLLRWTPYFISAKKNFIKNRLGEILDNLLRINMMSVASSTSKNSPSNLNSAPEKQLLFDIEPSNGSPWKAKVHVVPNTCR